jgi:hypothetical protein
VVAAVEPAVAACTDEFDWLNAGNDQSGIGDEEEWK